MNYEEDRPSWRRPDILVGTFDCTPQYGNPSGTTLEASASAFALYLDFMITLSHRSKKKFIWMLALLWLPFPLIYVFTVGMSRVVLGISSWNQVIFGWALGLWLAFAITFICRYRIRKHVVNKL